MPPLPQTAALKLYFPDSGGGPIIGPSDAGAEHFAGNLMAHLARECAQNAIDARKGEGPIKLSFKLEQMEASGIPEFKGGLNDAWSASADRHGDGGTAYPHVFAPAKAMLAGSRVPVLVISDSKTKGLVGIADRNNDTGSSWANLVKSTGVANSSKGAGGAFGIGKMAPFACSAVRTVFYQTCSKDGWGFQGVVRLMTHRDKNTDRTLQAFGMIGLKGHDKREGCEISLPVQERESVPELFRRQRSAGSLGTDIFVVGFVGDDDWRLHVKAALITNFFPAINDKYAEFEVDGEIIDEASILRELAALKKEALGAKLDDLVKELEHTYWYIKAREASANAADSWTLTKDLKHFGKVQIGIVQGTKDDIKVHGQLPARCFMCRSNRMKIFSKSYQLPFPYAAFMICDDEQGNELLRRLEPPTHTAWEKERDKSPRHAVYNELNKIYTWIRDEVAKLAPPITDESLTLESVARAIKGLNLPEEKGGEVDGNDAESLIKKGIKRSPFVRTSYGGDDVPLPTLPPLPPTEKTKNYSSIDIASSFTYRGNGRYVVKITTKTATSFKGDEILRLFAVNFSGSADEVAFELVTPKSDDQVNAAALDRISSDKFSPISLPAGHVGELCFVIMTEIPLLSLTAQLLAPLAPGGAAEGSQKTKRKPRKTK
jgi:hypothetical protein